MRDTRGCRVRIAGGNGEKGTAERQRRDASATRGSSSFKEYEWVCGGSGGRLQCASGTRRFLQADKNITHNVPVIGSNDKHRRRTHTHASSSKERLTSKHTKTIGGATPRGGEYTWQVEELACVGKKDLGPFLIIIIKVADPIAYSPTTVKSFRRGGGGGWVVVSGIGYIRPAPVYTCQTKKKKEL